VLGAALHAAASAIAGGAFSARDLVPRENPVVLLEQPFLPGPAAGKSPKALEPFREPMVFQHSARHSELAFLRQRQAAQQVPGGSGKVAL